MGFCLTRFQPYGSDHCQIAQERLAFGKKHAVATILMRFATFEPQVAGQITDNYTAAQ